ncbi:MAG: SRPBCC family protein [Burkholderiaceae bacterium]|nr:SRPBCC family protein [Burkholderiaceae bacterium]
MKLNNRFVVEAPEAQLWALFDELERVVPCMPGASYLGTEGQEHRVGMKVKIGAIVSNFQGTVSFTHKDEQAHVAIMRGAAKDTGGKGAASALIETRLTALAPGRTQVDVTTDLNMTGRLAQFGGPIVADIAQRLVQQFTDNLHKAVLSGQVQPDAAAAATSAPSAPAMPAAMMSPAAADVPALDLGAVVGRSLWRLLGRYALVLIAGFVLGWLTARLF